MDNMYAGIGIGAFMLLFFAGASFFYWVVSKCDNEKKGNYPRKNSVNNN